MDDMERKNAVDIINKHIQIGSPEMLTKLMEYGKQTGTLSAADLLKLWNGMPIDKCSDVVIQSVKNFFDPPQSICSSTANQRIGGFLDTLQHDSSRAPLESVLIAAEQDAQKFFDQELLYLNQGQLELVIENAGCTDRFTGASILSAIRRYLNWCLTEYGNVPAAYAVNNLRPDNFSYELGLTQKIVPTPIVLRDIIQATKDPDDINTDCVLISLYWYGLTEEESYNLKISDIDLVNATIRNAYFGIISIHPELIDTFRRYQENNVIQKGKQTWRADTSPYFLKKYHLKSSDERLNVQRMNCLVSLFAKKHTMETGKIMKISRVNLNLSGAFYRLSQRELIEDITDSVIAYEARIDKDNAVEIRRFKQKYERYKKIFLYNTE